MNEQRYSEAFHPAARQRRSARSGVNGWHARWYPVAGVALSLGAPLGLLLLREFFVPRPIAAELFSDRLTYLYVFLSTALVLGLVGFALGRQADRLAALSDTDALTGLANRRALRRRLNDEFARARRYGSPVSLIILDVDGLKQINDSRGHGAGDEVIQRVADVIHDSLRTNDLGARWGGDEFAIVAANTSRESARASAQRLIDRVAADSRPFDGVALQPTISGGVATFEPGRDGDLSIESLLGAADAALYQAKASGRNVIRTAGN